MPRHGAQSDISDDDAGRHPEVADSLSLALLVVLDSLEPAQRVAFVLHNVFNLPFEIIAPVVNRSPIKLRSLLSARGLGSPGQPYAIHPPFSSENLHTV